MTAARSSSGTGAALPLRSAPVLLVIAVVAIGGVLAGCSSSAADASPVATTTVDLPRSYRFEPTAISVEVGATVTWTNDDQFTHNVRFDGDEPLTMRPGESVTRTFEAPGTYPYVCSLHPQDMQGSVHVSGT